MLLEETSITAAIRDSMRTSDDSSFHVPEHPMGIERDDLKYECGCLAPIYSSNDNLGLVDLYRNRHN